MDDIYTADRVFEGEDFRSADLSGKEFEACTFNDCIFTESNLAGTRFTECRFNSCNLSMARLEGTSLNGVSMNECKLLGTNFERCNNFLLSIRFSACLLDHAVFFKLDLQKFRFRHCSLKEVDFTECNLKGLELDECDLAGARFDRTNLEKCDFRTAYHFSIDPEVNRLAGARFSLQGLPGLLDKYGILVG